MPTFTTLDNDTTDIDPEALTVHLLGPDPETDADSKAEKNTTDTSGADSTADNMTGAAENSGEPEAETDISESNVFPYSEADEKEIQEVEELLRKAKSSRTQNQKQPEIPGTGKPAAKRRTDPIVIVSCAAAAVLIFVFAAYFTGFFDKSSLKMTVDEFSAKYAATSGYKQISKYGFDFPDVSYSDDTTETTAAAADATDTTDAASTDATEAVKTAASTNRTFFGTFSNTLNYTFAITGKVNNSDENISRLTAALYMNDSNSFSDDMFSLYVPFIQVLYPDMNVNEAKAFLKELYTTTDAVTVKGSYALSMDNNADTSKAYFLCTLDILPASQADEFEASESSAAAAVS